MALLEKDLQAIPLKITLWSVTAAHMCYSKSEASSRSLLDLTEPQQSPATNQGPAL